MKCTTLVPVLVFWPLFVLGQSWETDYAGAVSKAKSENKLVLLNFTGSDWCGWCHKLKREVFNEAVFQQYANESLVLVEVDFPRKKNLPKKVKEQNKALLDKYGVKGFPTILLLDADERLILKTGYRKGGAAPYVRHLAAAGS